VDLSAWEYLRPRGFEPKDGAIYRSPDGQFVLRTGEPGRLHPEAEFAQQARGHGYPLPEITEVGMVDDEVAYFIERSAGERTFGNINLEDGFWEMLEIARQFFRAQLNPEFRPSAADDLREAIKLPVVFEENPDLDAGWIEEAVSRSESRIAELPLVYCHGDFTPFNIMPGGVIDFEHRLAAPFGYDVVTLIRYQRFWDHPGPNGEANARRYEFDLDKYVGAVKLADLILEELGYPKFTPHFDDFLILKAIWALAKTRFDEVGTYKYHRWQWRKRVLIYCLEQYLAGEAINTIMFPAVGSFGS